MTKRSVKIVLTSLLGAAVLATGVMAFAPTSAFAACDLQNGGIEGGLDCVGGGSNMPKNIFGTGGVFNTIANTALFIIGAISVLMLIYGGIRYTMSGGDSKAVEGAKNTILYAIIGVVIAVLAYAIVNFVLTTLIK